MCGAGEAVWLIQDCKVIVRNCNKPKRKQQVNCLLNIHTDRHTYMVQSINNELRWKKKYTHKWRHSVLEFYQIIPTDILSDKKKGFLKWAVTKVMPSLLVTSDMDVLLHEGIIQVEIVETLQKVYSYC